MKHESNLFDDLAVFIIAALVLILLFIILVTVKFASKICSKLLKCYEFLKKKLLYGSLLRYVLLGTLKMQISFGWKFTKGIQIDKLLEPESTAVRVFSMFMIVLLQFMPILFAVVLWRNRDKLSATPIKEKIGTMYYGLDAKKTRVGTYSVVYLFRRSIFIWLTFLLFYESVFQVQLMMLMSMAYICYISQMSFFETTFQRSIEIINECILLCIVYHWLAFANPVIYEDYQLMKAFGKSVIGFVLTLLAFNTVIILWVNIKAIYNYCRRRMIKKKLLR